MAGLGAVYPTITDIAKRLDHGGNLMDIAEILDQTNDIMKYIPWMEGATENGHIYAVRTKLPTPVYRKANEGTTPTKSTTNQVTEGCATLDDWAICDAEVADRTGNVARYRIQEARAHIESMGQTFTQDLFQGDVTLYPERFDGLNKRYASTTGTSGQNVILGGGAGSDNSSIWLFNFGPGRIYGFYPKGSVPGLKHEAFKKQPVFTSVGSAPAMFTGYLDHFQWTFGLAVEDWRYAVRICNIDISALVAQSSSADLVTLMKKAYHRLPSKNGNLAWAMNRTCFEMLDIQMDRGHINTSGGGVYYQNVDRTMIPTFHGIPIAVVDQLPENETLVS